MKKLTKKYRAELVDKVRELSKHPKFAGQDLVGITDFFSKIADFEKFIAKLESQIKE